MRTPTTNQQRSTSGDGAGRGPWGAVLAAVGVLVALVALYAVAAWALADRVPFNTTAGGVEIGGKSAEAAVAALEAEIGPREDDPVLVSIGEEVTELDPEEAGLTADLEGTVAEVTGFSLEPQRMWRHVVGAGRLELRRDAEVRRLDATLEELAERTDIAPADGDVVFPGGVPTPVQPVEGRSLDVPGAAAAVRSMWLVTDGPIPLPADTAGVEVNAQAVQAGLAVAEQAVSDVLVVVVGDREVGLPPEAYGDTLEMEPTPGGELGLAVDGETLRAAVLAADPDLEQSPRDAQVVLAGGRPSVVASSPGRRLVADDLAGAAVTALSPGGDRRAVVADATVEPDFTTADAEALGITEVVSTFSTNYPANADRTTNLAVASRTIAGTLLRPGEEFSLNDRLGERTLAKGYKAAGVISNGRFVEGVGGGVSQVSTTVYNAAFFAGLEILDHKPHSYFISRYPEGRESTLNWSPRVDMTFRNDTDTGILIDATVGGGVITVTFWGTKTWDVESVTSPRRSITEGGVVYDTSPACTSQAPITGFTVDVTRIWKRDGAEVKRDKDTWRYSSGDRIICGPEPAPPATP